jgi:acyl-CoA reductase-like NAD-dependent aldehyde dehydrogenase
MSRLSVNKTYKLYVGGKFVRSESGRSLQTGGVNFPHASRKDLRDAVVAARGAFDGWRKATPYNRGQVLYRVAEMLEARAGEFASLGERNVQASVDRCVYYCGWSDKFAALQGSVNPVSGPYFDFSVPEPMGVVAVVCAEGTGLLGLVSQVMPVIVSGNACVVVSSHSQPLSALEFGEVLATSDVPGGVVNILTGEKAELLPHLAAHMDVNAIDYRDGDAGTEAMLVEQGTENLKRIRLDERRPTAWWAKAQGPEWIEAFVETKTVWHPVGV